MPFVKMYHDNPALTGGPTTADVPEEAVRHWEKNGWSTVPFGRKAKGEAVPMYREIADGVATATVPDAAVHQLEAEGWTVRPFAQPKATKSKAKAEAVNA